MSLERLFAGIQSPAPKAYVRGTHRSKAPAETLARLQPLLLPMGITRVANVTGLDRIGIPTVIVYRPNSRVLAVSQGKGLSLVEAKVSGIMESVESYHAERVRLPLRLATLQEMRRHRNVVEVERLPGRLNREFHGDTRILWAEGYDLANEKSVWVPYEQVHLDFTLDGMAAVGHFQHGSNGLSSGNHLWEAISHGICEVVERDAMTLWSLASESERRACRVDLSTIDDADIQDLLDRYDRAEIEVGLWDITSDVGIPTFACCICERRDQLIMGYATHGFGCHPAPRIAALRSLTEAAQGRLTIVAGTREDNLRSTYDEIRQDDYVDEARDFIRNHGPARTFPTYTGPSHEDFREDVAWEVEQLRAVGVSEVIAVNLSHPEIDIPIVRVIIPGLEILIAKPDRYYLTDHGQQRLEGYSWKS